jgi:hypothetical protein
MNAGVRTFERFATEAAKPSKKKMFGCDARFEYTRENKKTVVEKRPDPSSYETIINWKGKNVSPKKQFWTEMVWKGQPLSVYH